MITIRLVCDNYMIHIPCLSLRSGNGMVTVVSVCDECRDYCKGIGWNFANNLSFTCICPKNFCTSDTACVNGILFSLCSNEWFTHSPEATFAICSPYSSSLVIYKKIGFALFYLLLSSLSWASSYLEIKVGINRLEIYYFLINYSLYLRMCIFCCTFARFFAFWAPK